MAERLDKSGLVAQYKAWKQSGFVVESLRISNVGLGKNYFLV